MAPPNPYQVLDLKPDASSKQIKDAFISKSKESHPDTNPDDPEGAAVRFQEIVAAYEFLNDADRKKQLDASLRRGPGGATSGDWRNKLRSFRDDGPRDNHRHIEVDMTLDAMKRRWSLYQKHWEKEEGRQKELEELKQAFRIKMDERRKMFDHLTPEEQAEYKESIRLFRHPQFSKGTTEVILNDQETKKRQSAPPPAAVSTPAAALAKPAISPATKSWLLNKILERIPGPQAYDSRSDPPPEMTRPRPKSDHLTSQRKRSFMSCKGTDSPADPSKRHYSSQPGPPPNQPPVDPYAHLEESSSSLSLSGAQMQITDFGKELDRVNTAELAVRKRQQKLQWKMYKAQVFNPKKIYDDDDPNFVEEKSYFKDEVNPLATKDITKMTTKEILMENYLNVAGNLKRVANLKVFTDGGPNQKDGHRPRDSINLSRKVGLMAALGLVVFPILYMLETGVIDLYEAEEYNPNQYISEALRDIEKEVSEKNKNDP